MPKAEIGWERTDESGTPLQVYAQHVGRAWVFYRREKRYDRWQPVPDPPLEDWLELLDAIKRRIGRGMLRPEEEPRVRQTIRERFPDAPLDPESDG